MDSQNFRPEAGKPPRRAPAYGFRQEGPAHPGRILRNGLTLQRVFSERLADIQALIAQQDRMAQASEELIASLMGQAFDSEITSRA